MYESNPKANPTIPQDIAPASIAVFYFLLRILVWLSSIFYFLRTVELSQVRQEKIYDKMLESLENVTFDEMISIKEGISIIGDEESFLANLKYYAEAFQNEVQIVHTEWLK